jgi:ribose transport system substrate-binding protein
VQQEPESIGKVGVDTAKLLIDGKPVERNIPVPLALITQ